MRSLWMNRRLLVGSILIRRLGRWGLATGSVMMARSRLVILMMRMVILLGRGRGWNVGSRLLRSSVRGCWLMMVLLLWRIRVCFRRRCLWIVLLLLIVWFYGRIVLSTITQMGIRCIRDSKLSEERLFG